MEFCRSRGGLLRQAVRPALFFAASRAERNFELTRAGGQRLAALAGRAIALAEGPGLPKRLLLYADKVELFSMDREARLSNYLFLQHFESRSRSLLGCLNTVFAAEKNANLQRLRSSHVCQPKNAFRSGAAHPPFRGRRERVVRRRRPG